jgi:hypothetical protein
MYKRVVMWLNKRALEEVVVVVVAQAVDMYYAGLIFWSVDMCSKQMELTVLEKLPAQGY